MGEQRRPGFVGCGISALLFVASIAAGVWVIFSALSFIKEALIPLDMPGEHTVQLEAPGTYIMYYERDPSKGHPPSMPAFQVSVVGADGAEVAVEATTMSQEYSYGSVEGEAIAQFEIDAPGEYTISGWYPEDAPGDAELRLTVGQGVVTGMVMRIFAAIGVMIVGCGAAAIIGIIVLIRRATWKPSPPGVPPSPAG